MAAYTYTQVDSELQAQVDTRLASSAESQADQMAIWRDQRAQ